MESARLHETVSISEEGVQSLRDALERDAIPPTHKPLQQLAFLRDCQASLTGVLLEPPPDPDIAGAYVGPLRRLRARLSALLECDAEVLGAPSDGHRVPGWNRLMLAWIVQCQVHTVLLRMGGPDALVLAFDASRSRYLRRNEVVVFEGRVGAYSMSQLRLALDTLRCRLDVLDIVRRDLAQYVGALEARVAVLLCTLVDEPGARDVRMWAGAPLPTAQHAAAAAAANRPPPPPPPNRSFAVMTAWWFVWIKRYIHACIDIGSGVLLPHRRAAVPLRQTLQEPWWPGDTLGEAVAAFLLRYARSQRTDEHLRSFRTLAMRYEVWPGELEVQTHLYGLSGAERATVRDVLVRERTEDAASHIVFKKYKRSLQAWIESAVRRRLGVGNDMRPLGGGGTEACIERLAVLHALNAYFSSRLRVPWAAWFVCLMRSATTSEFFLLNAQKAVHNGLPFIVQRMGRYAVWAGREGAGYAATGLLYDVRDIFDAIGLWALFVLDGHGGRLHGHKACAPLLRLLIGRAHRQDFAAAHIPIGSFSASGGGGDATSVRAAAEPMDERADDDDDNDDALGSAGASGMGSMGGMGRIMRNAPAPPASRRQQPMLVDADV
jgi:hypothetical protein